MLTIPARGRSSAGSNRASVRVGGKRQRSITVVLSHWRRSVKDVGGVHKAVEFRFDGVDWFGKTTVVDQCADAKEMQYQAAKENPVAVIQGLIQNVVRFRERDIERLIFRNGLVSGKLELLAERVGEVRAILEKVAFRNTSASKILVMAWAAKVMSE